MSLSRLFHGSRWTILGCLLLAGTASGCLQTSVGGQTLPSAYYLADDIQYFPAGPETRLPNQRRALERYRLERAALEAGVQPAPGP